jgi:hypothetical protein
MYDMNEIVDGVDTFYTNDDVNISARNSKDKGATCVQGRKLLELCTSARLRILNGRIIGDSQGLYTCHKFMGNSVVDYVIMNEELLSNVLFFQVDEFVGELSDHCCLEWSVKCNYRVISKPKVYSNMAPIGFKWDDGSIMKFQNALASEGIVGQIDSFLGNGNQSELTDVESMLKEVNQIYIETAQMSLKKNFVQRNMAHTSKSKVKHKRWFDNNLQQMKRDISKKSYLLQQYPYNTLVRGQFFKALKMYNKEKKRKARKYKESIVKKLNLLRNTKPQDYWKLLKSFKCGSVLDMDQISLEEWKIHFSNLNTKCHMKTVRQKDIKNSLDEIEKVRCFNEMDFRITNKEIETALQKMKRNKAVGLDLISAEMLKYSQHCMLPVLNKLFNSIFVSKQYPKEWCTGYLVPVPKNNDLSDPSNFRGIAILSNLSKLFNSILNARLVKFFSEHKLIDEKQIGFKKGSRASDHILTLQTIVDKYTVKGKKLYTCFVDFKKAFDTVDHTSLFYKLCKVGIGEHVYELIKSMYTCSDSKLCVKVGQYLSDFFKTEIGIRQGDVLSPVLFKAFINDILLYIKDCNPPRLNNMDIECLLYADDLVLLSQSEDGLQKAVQGLFTYCEEWGLQLNAGKTKILTFNKKGQNINTNIKFGEDSLDSVLSYKYLGLLLNVDGSFTNAKEDLNKRGMKSMFKLTSMFKDVKPNFLTSMHLFDHIVKPVLLYGADVWGVQINRSKDFFKVMSNDILDKCHMSFLRYVLGVSKRTPKLGLYGDTGRYSFYIDSLVQFMKNWHRIANMNPVSNNLLHNVYIENMNNIHCKNSWFQKVRFILKFVGIDEARAKSMSSGKIINMIRAKFQEEFRDSWYKELYNDVRKGDNGNKLRSYRTYKNIFKQEDYLVECKNMQCLKYLARLRLSSHKLSIETGRYVSVKDRVKPENRICIHCNLAKCEDEFHFLIECPRYEVMRTEFFSQVEQQQLFFHSYSPEIKFTWLMASEESFIINSLSSFVFRCFMKRNNQGDYRLSGE